MAFYHVLLCFPEQFQTSSYLQPTTAGPLSLTTAEQQATVQRERFLFNNLPNDENLNIYFLIIIHNLTLSILF